MTIFIGLFLSFTTLFFAPLKEYKYLAVHRLIGCGLLITFYSSRYVSFLLMHYSFCILLRVLPIRTFVRSMAYLQAFSRNQSTNTTRKKEKNNNYPFSCIYLLLPFLIWTGKKLKMNNNDNNNYDKKNAATTSCRRIMKSSHSCWILPSVISVSNGI